MLEKLQKVSNRARLYHAPLIGQMSFLILLECLMLRFSVFLTVVCSKRKISCISVGVKKLKETLSLVLIEL